MLSTVYMSGKQAILGSFTGLLTFEAILDSEIFKKFAPASVATALASIVFPVRAFAVDDLSLNAIIVPTQSRGYKSREWFRSMSPCSAIKNKTKVRDPSVESAVRTAFMNQASDRYKDMVSRFKNESDYKTPDKIYISNIIYVCQQQGLGNGVEFGRYVDEYKLKC
ncbi:hypothetical protein PHJA_002630600 [Phtheirospermum japonicum]|uniref:Uncharacterized protein n=1 Tax=Phtheirospermum japonicum TaxID=374723 RepID=A0A830D8G9_9LAMI|nr:hypothetical protein PHJA_002630600 [Phtheirospermum japonicum]